MVFPNIKQIEINDDTVLIRSGFEGVQHLVHIDVTSHDEMPVSTHGHSIGVSG